MGPAWPNFHIAKAKNAQNPTKTLAMRAKANCAALQVKKVIYFWEVYKCKKFYTFLDITCKTEFSEPKACEKYL